MAEAICNVVKHPQGEVVFGSGGLVTNLYRIASGLTQWLLQRSLDKQDGT